MSFSLAEEQKSLIKNLLEPLEPDSGPNLVFLLGGADTGKTGFSLNFAFQALKRGLKVGMVDADVGQSSFGPPTTVGFVCFPSSVVGVADLLEINPTSVYFVGNTSPQGHLLEMLVGVKSMVEKAEDKKCDLIIVDTTGMISYPFGCALKYHKINLLSPHHIVVFQREKETEPILTTIPQVDDFKIHRIPVSEIVRRTSFLQRAKFRQQKYRTYFRGSHCARFKANDLSLYPPRIDLRNPDRRKELFQVVVGLKNSPKEALGIGIFSGYRREDQLIEIFTPVDGSKVTSLVFGSIKINSQGEELGQVFLRKLQ